MGSYLFGPAGWSYKDWEEPVYGPKRRLPGFNRLLFIARRFDFVELNTSFYQVPSFRLIEGWQKVKRECPQLAFQVKGWQKFTHERDWKQDELKLFRAFLEELRRAKLFYGILWQFPYSFAINDANLSYLERVTADFADYPQSLEFRKLDWNESGFLDWMKGRNLTWVNIDQPVMSRNLPLTSIITNRDAAYFRFHGRNAANWFSGEGRDQRYDYEYNLAELGELRTAVEQTAAASRVFIVFNNHYRGSAVRNLEKLREMMPADQEH